MIFFLFKKRFSNQIKFKHSRTAVENLKKNHSSTYFTFLKIKYVAVTIQNQCCQSWKIPRAVSIFVFMICSRICTSLAINVATRSFLIGS